MATIRDIAKIAGFSGATVSRVLSGDSSFKVSEATRQKITEAAYSLGYEFPVRSGKRTRIGCIMSITTEKYSDPFFMDILSAVERECERLGFSIAGTKTYSELSNPMALKEFLALDLKAVILMEQFPKEMLSFLKEKIPIIISVDNDYDDYEFNSVGFDHRIADTQVMDCLLGRGYRRIGMISGSSPGDMLMDSVRFKTYVSSLNKAGIPYDPALVKDCSWDKKNCIQLTKELMGMENPPDVIFAGSDSLAEAVLSTLHEMGIRCPEDVGVIGFNNLDSVNYMIPKLTTISVPRACIGSEAVRLISEMLKTPDYPVRKVLFRTELVVRDSLRK
ncbi:MAG: LacI family transcriptional regulator [Lachnospiraceae bacterium]|nr:LacI family transcriptional regulator [Lachnospiraceae bacterium]